MEYKTDVFWDVVNGWVRCRHCTGVLNGRPLEPEWKDLDTNRCTHKVMDTRVREQIDGAIIESFEKLNEAGFQPFNVSHALSEIAAPLQYEASEEVIAAFERCWPGTEAGAVV